MRLLVCAFTFDRYHQSMTGVISKSACDLPLDPEIRMPMFTHGGLHMDMVGYIPVAGTAHWGTDLCGHCRPVLKIQPTVVRDIGPAAWILTEDDQLPRPTWTVPTWFTTNLNMVWAVRTDCMRIPAYVDPCLHDDAHEHMSVAEGENGPLMQDGMDDTTIQENDMRPALPQLTGHDDPQAAVMNDSQVWAPEIFVQTVAARSQ